MKLRTKIKKAIRENRKLNFNEYDSILFLKSLTKKEGLYLHKQNDYSDLVDSGKWREVFPSAEKISKDINCSQKTVYRYAKDFRHIIKRVKNRRGGKFTTNTYIMKKHLRNFFKVLGMMGFFKGIYEDERFWWKHFQSKIRDLEKLIDRHGSMCGVVNSLNLRKSLKYNGMFGGYEHSRKNLSDGNSEICPTISTSYILLEKGTCLVPPLEVQKIQKALEGASREALNDIKWNLDKGIEIKSYAGLYKHCLGLHLLRKKRA